MLLVSLAKPICGLCGGQIHRDSHKFRQQGVCSLQCSKALEAAKEIAFLAEAQAFSYKDHTSKPVEGYSKTLIIGDTHFPWAHEGTLKRIFNRIEEFQPKFIIQIGDLYDFFSQSRFPRSQGLITPRDEMEKGRHMAEEMWRQIGKRAPDARKLQMLGNHDSRPYKRLIERAPELEPFLNINAAFHFDGVEAVLDTRQEIIIEGICYQHGHKKFGEHMKYNLCPSIHGHTHRGGLSFMNLRGQTIFEMDVGFVANPESEPLSYNPQKWVYWTLGWGEVDELGPRFIL